MAMILKWTMKIRMGKTRDRTHAGSCDFIVESAHRNFGHHQRQHRETGIGTKNENQKGE